MKTLIQNFRALRWFLRGNQTVLADSVGGGWIVKTERGYFTRPTKMHAIREAWIAR